MLKGLWQKILLGGALAGIPISVFAAYSNTTPSHLTFSDVGQYSETSALLVGYSHYFGGSYDRHLSVGYGNVIYDRNYYIGDYLISEFTNPGDSAGPIVIGKYNDRPAISNSTPVFTIGSGENNIIRKNALEVYEGGQIIIPQVQGDISMGIFGN